MAVHASKKTTTATKAGRLQKPTPTTRSRKSSSPSRVTSNAAGSGLTTFPTDIPPMLATLVDKPVEEPGWTYEFKWDGYRAIAYIQEGRVELRSRNNKSFDEKFYPIHEALSKWKLNVVLDGEIIVVNEKGLSDFSGLQTWRSEADGQLVYYAFDILWYNGEDLTKRSLEERRKILDSIIPADQHIIQKSKVIDATGPELFALTDKLGMEGIIAKKDDSIYLPGIRSKEWLKIKTEQRQEAIIAGYTKNENTSKQFSALLMGFYENGELVFIGPVGTGFTNQIQTEILSKLKPLITPVCPFRVVPEYNKPSRFRPDPPKADVTWVKPEIVAEISFRASTKGGALRQPSFKGLREDKQAKDVVREVPVEIKSLIEKEDQLLGKQRITSTTNTERRTLLNPSEESQVRAIDGHELKFANLSKYYWPEEKITKRDMLNYYYQVAPYMLPYMKDRPQTLNRFPNGIHGISFYQKDVSGKVPSWIKNFPYHSERDERDKNFLVATNEASLLYIASLGCIEMNPWSSKAATPDNPDWCIIDFDPDNNPFEQVIKAAQVTKEVLDQFKVPAYCKTSGSTGLHIYIPLQAKYSYEQSKEFGRVIVKLVHAQIPSFTSIERLTDKRKGCIYLDFLQNRPQATVAAPYSLRPKPGAPVSAPLLWEEVKTGLSIRHFHIFNMIDRLKEVGDLFKPVLGKGINLEKIKKEMESYLK